MPQSRLLGRYLATLGRKHGLDEGRIRLLYCLEESGEPLGVEALALLAGMGKPAVIVGLARLLADGLVRREPPAEDGERFSFQAEELTGELQQLNRDVDAVRFDGFTEEEIREYRAYEECISASILRHLQAETAGK